MTSPLDGRSRVRAQLVAAANGDACKRSHGTAALDLALCASHAAAVRRELGDAIAALDALPDELGEHVGDVRVRLSRALRESALLEERAREAGRLERLTNAERGAR